MSQTTEARWEQHNEAGCRYFGQGAYAQAEQEFLAAIREANTLGPENLRLASSLNNLGQLRYRQRDFARAETLFRQSLAMREHALGPEHAAVAQSVNNLATLHYARGELDAAEPLARRALAIRERTDDPNDPALAMTRRLVAEIRAARASSPLLSAPIASPVSQPPPRPAAAPLSSPPSRPVSPPPTALAPDEHIVLQPFPDSVLPVGAPTPRESPATARREATGRRPDPHHAESHARHAHETHQVRDAHRDVRRTPAATHPATMHSPYTPAAHATRASEGDLGGALFKLVIALAIIASAVWLAAGRPPLNAIVTAITRSTIDRASAHPGNGSQR